MLLRNALYAVVELRPVNGSEYIQMVVYIGLLYRGQTQSVAVQLIKHVRK